MAPTRVSIPAVEAIIALSIIFLASEIARNNRDTLAWRRPIIMASGFGLVHGAGFAAALGEFGLPQTETLGALLFFNLGVEAGQLAIVLAALATVRFGPQLANIDAPRSRAAFSYSLGIISAVWFFERLAGAVP